MMAVAIRSRSVKEAQASTTLVVRAISLLPAAVCVALTGVALASVARALRGSALR